MVLTRLSISIQWSMMRLASSMARAPALEARIATNAHAIASRVTHSPFASGPVVPSRGFGGLG